MNINSSSLLPTKYYYVKLGGVSTSLGSRFVHHLYLLFHLGSNFAFDATNFTVMMWVWWARQVSNLRPIGYFRSDSFTHPRFIFVLLAPL